MDTNIFLEIILEQQRAQEARDLLLRTEEHVFFITDFSLHSIGLLLFRRKQQSVFEQFLKDILIDGPISLLQLGIGDMERLVSISQDFNFDFDDAYQHATAEKYELTIVSFNSDFDRTERGRKAPGEIESNP